MNKEVNDDIEFFSADVDDTSFEMDDDINAEAQQQIAEFIRREGEKSGAGPYVVATVSATTTGIVIGILGSKGGAIVAEWLVGNDHENIEKAISIGLAIISALGSAVIDFNANGSLFEQFQHLYSRAQNIPLYTKMFALIFGVSILINIPLGAGLVNIIQSNITSKVLGSILGVTNAVVSVASACYFCFDSVLQISSFFRATGNYILDLKRQIRDSIETAIANCQIWSDRQIINLRMDITDTARSEKPYLKRLLDTERDNAMLISDYQRIQPPGVLCKLVSAVPCLISAAFGSYLYYFVGRAGMMNLMTVAEDSFFSVYGGVCMSIIVSATNISSVYYLCRQIAEGLREMPSNSKCENVKLVLKNLSLVVVGLLAAVSELEITSEFLPKESEAFYKFMTTGAYLSAAAIRISALSSIKNKNLVTKLKHTGLFKKRGVDNFRYCLIENLAQFESTLDLLPKKDIQTLYAAMSYSVSG